MKLVNRLGREISDADLAVFRERGIAVDTEHNVFIDVENPNFWKFVSKMQFKEGCYLLRTDFTKAETNRAKYLSVDGTPRFGSPLPQHKWWQSAYDQSTFCRHCFAKADQIAPFKIRSTPRILHNCGFELPEAWGRLIVSTDVYESVFRELGVGRRDIVSGKDQSPVEGISQLIIPGRVDVDVRDFDIHEICRYCSTIRYSGGPLFGFYSPSGADFDVALTNQSFGAGVWATSNAVIISQKVYRKLIARKVKGLIFEPCREKT